MLKKFPVPHPPAMRPRFPAALRRSLRRRRWQVAGIVALMVATIVGSQGLAPLAQAQGTRDLESITIELSSSGDITSVSGASVMVDAKGTRGKSTSATYAPRTVADDLPVRIRTSYRTPEGAGTDLADLEGYTGHVVIDLSVENLTVQPQTVSYDAGGVSHTRTVMVGAPLTVTASAALPGSPSSVVTAGADGDTVTNGILSQDADRKPQVQWAAILAPPQLGATANLRLVLDATDLKVPEFNISVQAGLTTDPSVQGLMNSAFRVDSGSQLAMTTSTIEGLGMVNNTLALAYAIVDRTMTTLGSNAETIGAQSAADLSASSQSLTTQMQTTGTELSRLSESLAATVTTTQSATAAQLLQVVNTASQALGDTTQAPSVPSLPSSGCGVTQPAPPPSPGPGHAVTPPPNKAQSPSGGTAPGPESTATSARGNGVYGSITHIAGLLNAYAQANEVCRTEITAQLQEALGAVDTSGCAAESTSATCVLARARTDITTTISNLSEQASTVTAALQPAVRASVLTGSASLDKDIKAVEDALEAIKPTDDQDPAQPPGQTPPAGTADLTGKLQELKDALSEVSPSIEKVKKTVEGIHTSTESAAKNNKDALTQIDAAAADLCAQMDADPNAETLRTARAKLTAKSCDGQDNGRGNGTSATELLATQSETLDKILSASDTTTPGADTATLFSDLGTSTTSVSNAVTTLEQALNGDPNNPATPSLQTSLDTLRTAIGTLRTDYGTLNQAIADLDAMQTEAAANVATAFQQAEDQASTQVSQTIDTQINRVGSQSQTTTATVSASFETAIASMRAQSTSLAGNASQTIGAQLTQLDQQATQSSQDLSTQFEDSLTTMMTGFGSSVTDIEAARTLLAADLQRVLLDVGSADGTGSGLIGIMSRSAALSGAAAQQVAQASQTVSANAAIRGQDVERILVQQAQIKASLLAQYRVKGLDQEANAVDQNTIVFNFHVGAAR